MKTNVLRRASVLAGCAWLGVAGYGISRAITDSAEEWSVAYAMFTVALLLGAASTVLIVLASITVAAIVSLTRNADRFANLPSPSHAPA